MHTAWWLHVGDVFSHDVLRPARAAIPFFTAAGRAAVVAASEGDQRHEEAAEPDVGPVLPQPEAVEGESLGADTVFDAGDTI